MTSPVKRRVYARTIPAHWFTIAEWLVARAQYPWCSQGNLACVRFAAAPSRTPSPAPYTLTSRLSACGPSPATNRCAAGPSTRQPPRYAVYRVSATPTTQQPRWSPLSTRPASCPAAAAVPAAAGDRAGSSAPRSRTWSCTNPAAPNPSRDAARPGAAVSRSRAPGQRGRADRRTRDAQHAQAGSPMTRTATTNPGEPDTGGDAGPGGPR